MKRFIIAFISATLATLILVGGVHAYTLFRSVFCDLTIIEGIKDIELYADEARTIVLADPIHFGELRRGEVYTFEMWVENTGVEPVNLGATIVGSITWGTVTVTPSVTLKLEAGESRYYLLEITIPISTSLGSRSFSLEFSEE